jgi:hypothetical protein
MGNVTELWNTRNLQRGLRRHWIPFREKIHISGGQANQSGVLSIHQPMPGGPLFATLDVEAGQLTEEIGRGGELVIDFHELRLVVVVRAVEDTRALLEFGVPRGQQAHIALSA